MPDELFFKGYDIGESHGLRDAWNGAMKLVSMGADKREAIFGDLSLSEIMALGHEEVLQEIYNYEREHKEHRDE